MSLLERIKNLIHTDRIANWPLRERTALVRILYSACAADEAYTTDEQRWLQGVMKDAGLSWPQIQQLQLSDAVACLMEDAAKEAQLYPLLAEALFSDGDFDVVEKAFVDKLVVQGLSRDKIDASIKQVRDRIFGDALSGWSRDIKDRSSGDGSSS